MRCGALLSTLFFLISGCTRSEWAPSIDGMMEECGVPARGSVAALKFTDSRGAPFSKQDVQRIQARRRDSKGRWTSLSVTGRGCASLEGTAEDLIQIFLPPERMWQGRPAHGKAVVQKVALVDEPAVTLCGAFSSGEFPTRTERIVRLEVTPGESLNRVEASGVEAQLAGENVSKRLEVTEKGCVVVPPGALGTVKARFPERNLAGEMVLSEGAPMVSLTLAAASEPDFRLRCSDLVMPVSHDFFPEFSLSGHDLFGVSVAFQFRDAHDFVALSTPPRDPAAAQTPVSLDPLPEGKYEVFPLLQNRLGQRLSGGRAVCRIEVDRTPPEAPAIGRDLAGREELVVQTGSPLSTTLGASDALEVCRMQANEGSCSDYQPTTDVVMRSSGRWNVCLRAVDPAGNRSAPHCRIVVVDDQAPAGGLAWSHSPGFRNGGVLSAPVRDLEVKSQWSLDDTTSPSDLESTLECRLVQVLAGGEVRSATNARCVGGTCAGAWLSEYQPCAGISAVHLEGSWSSFLNTVLRLETRFRDRAGRWGTSAASLRVHPFPIFGQTVAPDGDSSETWDGPRALSRKERRFAVSTRSGLISYFDGSGFTVRNLKDILGEECAQPLALAVGRGHRLAALGRCGDVAYWDGNEGSRAAEGAVALGISVEDLQQRVEAVQEWPWLHFRDDGTLLLSAPNAELGGEGAAALYRDGSWSGVPLMAGMHLLRPVAESSEGTWITSGLGPQIWREGVPQTPEPLKGKRVFHVYADRGGRVWFDVREGAPLLLRSGSWKELLESALSPEETWYAPFGTQEDVRFTETSDGKMLVSTQLRNGFRVELYDDGRFVRRWERRSVAPDVCRSLHLDDAGTLWILCQSFVPGNQVKATSLERFREGKWDEYTFGLPAAERTQWVGNIEQGMHTLSPEHVLDEKGRLLLLAENGRLLPVEPLPVIRFDGVNTGLEGTVPTEDFGVLQYGGEDGLGRPWILAAKGLAYLQEGEWKRVGRFGMAFGGEIGSFQFSSDRRSVFVLTKSGLLQEFDTESGRLVSESAMGSGERLDCLVVDGLGQVTGCVPPAGLGRLTPRQNFHQFWGGVSSVVADPRDPSRSLQLVVDADGAFITGRFTGPWGTWLELPGTGVFQLHGASLAAILPDGRRIRSVSQAPDGAIWLRHDMGLTRFSSPDVANASVSEIPTPEHMPEVFFDAKGRVWMLQLGEVPALGEPYSFRLGVYSDGQWRGVDLERAPWVLSLVKRWVSANFSSLRMDTRGDLWVSLQWGGVECWEGALDVLESLIP